MSMAASPPASETPVPVSVIGIGIMGTAIATRLLARGHAVTIFGRTPDKLAALEALGAVSTGSPAEAAAASPFIITCVNTAAIVREIVFGPGGIAEAPAARRLLIDMSSIDPAATRDMAAALVRRTDMHWVDAPLSGGAPGALAGRLTVMAGGAAEDVARARAVMDSLCANYTHMGPSGAGQTTKLVNQLLCAIAFQACAEAVRLAEAGGVDAGRLAEALAGGRADSRILQEFGPRMARRDEALTGRIENMLKDLEAVQRVSSATRIPLPLTSHVSDLFRQFVAAGLGHSDLAAIMRQFTGFGEAERQAE
jgi:2-hydroxy-3-oxopropionate reductase